MRIADKMSCVFLSVNRIFLKSTLSRLLVYFEVSVLGVHLKF